MNPRIQAIDDIAKHTGEQVDKVILRNADLFEDLSDKVTMVTMVALSTVVTAAALWAAVAKREGEDGTNAHYWTTAVLRQLQDMVDQTRKPK